MNKEQQKKATHAMLEGSENKYTVDYFKKQGVIGYKRKLKKYGKKGMSLIAKKAWETKRLKTVDN